jgi:uncharacterized protein
MDADEIIQAFATAGNHLPVEAMLRCRADWNAVAPRLVGVLARYADGTDRSETAEKALFFILHMAGERGETRAFVPLCRFARDADAIEQALGDGITATFASIVIGTYDGELGTLQQLIDDPDADDFVRVEALQAMGFLTASGRIAGDAMASYLRRLHDSVLPREASYLWYAWAFVTVLLRLEPMEAQVEDVFARGWFPLEICHADGFRAIRDEALGDANPLASFVREGIEPIEDAIDTLSQWHSFANPEDADDELADDELADDDDLARFYSDAVKPAVNPYKDVGRNDPCPCGSGKKFKKCCLGATPA